MTAKLISAQCLRQDIFLQKQTDVTQAPHHQFLQGLLDAHFALIFVADTE